MKQLVCFLLFSLLAFSVSAQKICRIFDSLGRLTFIRYPDSSSITCTYDPNGNLTSKRYHDPCTTKPRPNIASSGPLTFCAGGSVVLSIPPGITSNWSTGAVGSSISITTSGSYWVQRTDSFVIVGTSDTIQCKLTSDTIVVSVNEIPVMDTVSNRVVCNGVMSEVINFTSATSGTTYTWSNTNTSVGLAASGIGNVGAFSAINTGVSSVDAVIIVTPTAAGCVGMSDTFIITVNPTPTVSIPSSQVLCAGGMTSPVIFSGSLSTTVYNWTNSNSTIGLASSGSGSIPAFVALNGSLAPLVATVSTTPVANGCAGVPQDFIITVNPLPPSISGSGNICLGSTITLTNAISGGTWSSGSANVSIGLSSGIATGMGIGTSAITYTLPSGCRTIRVFTVTPLPMAITGTNHVCAGFTVSLSNPSPGGIWSSDSVSIATVGATTGIVTGVTSGIATISYTLSTGCFVTTNFTVNSFPSSIAGPSSVCIGSSITLGNEVSGGTWSSSNVAVASVGSLSGVVTGITVSTVVITYSLGGGCFVVKGLYVYPLPNVIAGPSSVCTGATISVSNSSLGGTWSSNNVSIASIGSTGIVSGISPGIVDVVYTMPTGCNRSKQITVNASPAAISGPNTVCSGSAIALSNTTPGGTWGTVATVFSVNPLSGIVTGISAGTSLVTYTTTNGCIALKSITALLSPAPIAGSDTVCVGSSVTMYNSTYGGTWGSANSLITSIGSTTGIVAGVSPGATTISYTVPSGCSRAIIVTVYPLPADIVGPDNVCVGYTSILSSITPGGIWVSSNTAKAIVGTSTGVVTGVSAGTANITYTLTTGCRKLKEININSLPASITGGGNMCVGSSTTLLSTTSSGSWSSDDSSIATVSSSGVVHGVASGTTIITYMLPTGCYRTTIVTVNPLPMPISGTPSICMGASISLTDATPSGTWSSSVPGVASIGLTSGIATGITVGTVTITYKLSSGCYVTTDVTVNTLPATIAGTSGVCVGASVTLSNTTTGGVWTTSNPSIATVGSLSGIVSGNSVGTVVITYTLGTGCLKTKLLSVNPLPSVISGTLIVCEGSTITLSNAVIGGAWTSSAPSVATVTSGSGIVSGISSGTTTVSYVLPTGCFATAQVTVNPIPAAILGSAAICIAQSSTLNSPSTGGTWTSSNIGVATVGSISGSVTGVAVGTTRITYTLPTGCFVTRTVTVLPFPPAISGAGTVCQGMVTTLSNSTGGGTWSSPDGAGILTVGATGIVTGVAPGTATILYTLSSGCSSNRIITVNSLPASIGGASSVCQGSVATVVNSVSGGVWASNNTSIASIGSVTGVVTGVSAGTVVLTYTLGTGCHTTKILTVYAAVAAISGPATLCEGSSSVFGNTTISGLWTSSNSSVASVGSSTGSVIGVSVGTVTLSYTMPSTSCSATKVITVNAIPTPISGLSNICAGSITSLASSPSGGSWSTSNASVISVGSTGVVLGVNSGIATISYTLGTGCRATKLMTINPNPSAIGGALAVCVGSTTSLTNATSSGLWSSGSLSVASIGSISGIMTGVTAGTSVITYTLPTGCYKTVTVTINPAPPMIGGTGSICVGSTAALSDPVLGGTWSSSNTSVASVGITSAIVNGLSAGTSVITYVTSPGCFVTTIITVNTSPAAISGSNNVCIGSSTGFSNAISGGFWTSSNASVASVGSLSGIVSGISVGIASITYTLGSGCHTVRNITVNVVPGDITGLTSLCIGTTVTLANSTSGGSWSSSNTDIATIGSTTGNVTGVNVGTTTVSYILPSGCITTSTVTVLSSPAAIFGAAPFCQGATLGVSCYPLGGTWSSSSTAVATISTSGVITGVSNGTSRITYALSTGCLSTQIITVNPLPAVITGTLSVCSGLNTTLGNATGGGTWSSSSITTAYISTTGVVTGYSIGTATMTYIIATGCIRTATVTVNESPSAITGTGSICVSSTLTLGNAVAGGTWVSSSPAIASVTATTGIVTGVTAGTPIISYILPNGCKRTAYVTINPLPSSIGGPSSVCSGSIITLTNSLAGGTWSSASTAIGTIGVGSGILYGVSVGTTLISYLSSVGCLATKIVSVNSIPTSGVISGPAAVSIGSSIALSSTVSGGTWSSSNTSKATVTSAGLVTGVSAGSCTISYRVANGCGSSVTTFGVAIASSKQPIVLPLSSDIENKIKIFPNPNSGSFTISGTFNEENEKIVQLKISDVLGRIVFVGSTQIRDGQISKEVILNDDLANGTYMLVVQSDIQIGNFHVVILR